MSNENVFYYLQLQFSNTRSRNRAYKTGITPLSFDIELSPDKMFQILYNEKNMHSTGARKVMGQETVPTIDMIVEVNPNIIESLSKPAESHEMQKKSIKKGTLALTTRTYSGSRLELYKGELEAECSSLNINDKGFEIRRGDMFDLRYLEGRASGEIRQILGLYDFAKERGLRHSTLDLTFN